MNWHKELLEAEEREKKARQGLDRPFSMYVDSVTSDSEVAKMSFFGNTDRSVPIAHPFISTGSWIRAIPEAGTQYISSYIAQESVPVPLVSTQRQTKSRIEAYRNSQSVYRSLLPGEIEVSSRGLGQSYFGIRPHLSHHGGIIERFSDQDKLLSADKSPIHTKRLFQHRYSELGDEYRLGLVQRPKNTWEVAYPKVRNDFAAEEYIHVKNPQNQNPAVLFQETRGHVLDEEGNQILQTVTQIPLRWKATYWANDESNTTKELDEKGNFLMSLATAAVEGYELRIPSGNYRESIQLNRISTVAGNEEKSIAKNSRWNTGQNLTISTGQKIADPQTLIENINQDKQGTRMLFDGNPNNEKFVITTKSGHLFLMDDTVGNEAVYWIHKTGAQIVVDKSGSLKLVAQDGASIFLDTNSGATTVTSAAGSFITLKDNITFSDSTGQQIFNFGGDTLQFSAGSNIILNAPTVDIKGGSINLGDGASFSSVLAEPLATLFDSHTHGTVVGPTSPPIPPNTASIINANPATAFSSEFVKIRGNI